MKIFNQHGVEISESEVDHSLGHLVADTMTIHHDAVASVEEVGHYEVVQTYSNGGKDVKWVVDTPGVEGHEAYDETVDIQRYVLYSESERKYNEIDLLKEKLRSTDYISLKVIEGSSTWDNYPGMKDQRQSWRDEINQLESEISALESEKIINKEK